MTLAAYPNLITNLDGGGVTGALRAAVLLTGWCVLWAASAGPREGDADVHDRQVDIILAAPLLTASVWLVLGFARSPVTTALSNQGVISLALFLAGTSLALLGTRLTGRVRWVLAMPLLAMPLFTRHPVVLLAVLATAVLLVLGRRGRRGPAGTSRAADWSRARLQPLPRIRASMAMVGAVGVVLVVTAVVAPTAPLQPPRSAPGSGVMDAAQGPAPLTGNAPGKNQP